MHFISESEKLAFRHKQERSDRERTKAEKRKADRKNEYQRTHTPRLMRVLPAIKLYLGCWDAKTVHIHQSGLTPKQIASKLNYNINTTRGYIRRFKLKPDTGPTNNYHWNTLHTFIYNYEGFSENAISEALNVDVSTVRNYRKFIEKQITEPDWEYHQVLP